MKLSNESRQVLEVSMGINKTSDAGRNDIEELIARIPDNRFLLYKYIVSNPLGDLPRYDIHIRIQHLLTFLTFLTLAFTGLPIAFFEHFWAVPVNSMLGGVNVTRIIHRALASVMIFAMAYHIVTITLGSLIKIKQGRFEVARSMIPTMKDVRDFRDDMLHFTGKKAQRPEMDKFMYKQKLHYFAAAFGNTVMIVSGSSFLFPEFWASVLPVSIAAHFQEMMRISHPHEALLALLVIAFWHWYNVHLAPGRFPMQWTFLTGKITREHQIEEHFLEYLRCLVEIPRERKQLRAMLDAMEQAEKDNHNTTTGV